MAHAKPQKRQSVKPLWVYYMRQYKSFLIWGAVWKWFPVEKKKLCYCSWYNYCVCSATWSPFSPSVSPPFLSYHNHVFPPGLIKRLSNRGRVEKREWGKMAAEESGPYYPMCLETKGRSGGPLPVNQWISLYLSISLSLLLPDSSIRDNMSGTDIARSGDHDRNTVVLREAKFHVKPLWSTKRPDSSTSCSIRLIVYRTL